MSSKDKKAEVFGYFKNVKGEFLCKVEENEDVCGAKLAAKSSIWNATSKDIMLTLGNVS